MISYDEEQKQVEEKAINNIKYNSKYFFTYTKSKSTIRPRVGPLNLDGITYSDNKDIANILNNQHKSVFSTPKYDPEHIESIVA